MLIEETGSWSLSPLLFFVPWPGTPFFSPERERKRERGERWGEAGDIWHLRTEIFGQGCSLIFFQHRSKWLLHLCFETTRPNFVTKASYYIYIHIYKMYIKLDKNIVSSVIFLFAENCKHYFFNFPLYLKDARRVKEFFPYLFLFYLSPISRDNGWFRATVIASVAGQLFRS